MKLKGRNGDILPMGLFLGANIKNSNSAVTTAVSKNKTKKLIRSLIAVTGAFTLLANISIVNETGIPRTLSIYLGNGMCQWTPPIYDVPPDLNFTKTLVAGYPSGDKRLTFVQMEALTELSARDEWDFAYLVSQV